ncbi:hypothetical protein [Deinococcus navajonensis]|uniref:Uncharacterized protein n=1 Tax=Deinococcus navajonensis TaxID=309884 RepID=A0ABV8XRG1_9DEIO
MSSIRNMMKQARPDPDPVEEIPVASRGEARRPLSLPAVPPPEERKPLSTRVKPSLKRVLEAYTKEIRDAGFPVTQELVLDALLRELRDNDDLRERVAGLLVEELS